MHKNFQKVLNRLCRPAAVSAAPPVAQKDFRVTAYLIGRDFQNKDVIDYSHFEQITDFILIGFADFDVNGRVILAENFETVYNNIAPHIPPGKRFYLNLLGPKCTLEGGSWNARMRNQGNLHTRAFESGKLEANTRSVLEKYGFDGVYFDYEYPINRKSWKSFNRFIVSLRCVLGDKYKIGLAMSNGRFGQSKEAMAVTDFVEIMNYDVWDKAGNHSTLENANKDIRAFLKKGYARSKLGLGLPFYARPTTQEEYWYDYKTYWNRIDENGLYVDSAATGLTFSFNTYDVIKKKVAFALSRGLGGVMVWNYAYDAPADNELALFNAIEDGIRTAYAENTKGIN